MALVDDLKTARESIVTKIKEISANPKPNYSIDGQSVQHGDFLRTLMESLTQLNEQIIALEVYQYKSQVL